MHFKEGLLSRRREVRTHTLLGLEPDLSMPYTSSRNAAWAVLGGQASEPDCRPKASPVASPAVAILSQQPAQLSPHSSRSFKSDWKMKPGHLFCRTQCRVDTLVMLKSYLLLKMSFLVKCHRNQCPRVSLKNAATLMDSTN